MAPRPPSAATSGREAAAGLEPAERRRWAQAAAMTAVRWQRHPDCGQSRGTSADTGHCRRGCFGAARCCRIDGRIPQAHLPPPSGWIQATAEDRTGRGAAAAVRAASPVGAARAAQPCRLTARETPGRCAWLPDCWDLVPRPSHGLARHPTVWLRLNLPR